MCRRLLKIHYVIAIHLMRWLTDFYDFRFKWTATAGIGIHPTKAWLSQLVNFKNAILKSGQWHFHQDNTPVHNSILVTDYLTKMGIKIVPHITYSPDLAPCNFCLFPKLTGCCYETIEEMKEAVTTVIDTLTQEDFHGAFNKCIAAGGDYFKVY